MEKLTYLTGQIEALIFTTDKTLNRSEILEIFEEHTEEKLAEDDLEAAIQLLKERYQRSEFAFELVEIADGLKFMTKGAYHDLIGTYLKMTTRKRLSRAALETLSIIAYKQPVTKGDLEKIRGVSCDYSVQKLLEKELIDIVGRSDAPGRPLLYVTSQKFMDYFGLANLKELPQPKDFKQPDSEIGERAPAEEDATSE